mmetsp:Transcript_4831/g.5634  ORF Transcript_4831/g.5634 Transcript_4831/m.5634 type:complete len:456 (+) Transcript_4831:225-1592(+)|eukprot:CAMPEP_0204839232 /NCGR_PEP_ID=MMETSP1346-20131115/33483_1 /ASSEMBLY_ACC=CAM_ASM_000771 /TAXON_ID=215587 /ORGANISM="Aplanochytrium stocchinoi, Strain GSBS06" /LENGTH=455 /DNA_ID=CAMNT_0051975809 /DNA_START=156 /DNA_END=1523 /DNA_ORIENTATION=-
MWTVKGILRSSPQVIPYNFTNNGTLWPSVSELSAITLVHSDTASSELRAILLGDGGTLYEATLTNTEGENTIVNLDFVRSSSLQIPPNMSFTHVDSESIAAICPEENIKGRFCDVSKNETTFLVGVEKGENSPAGIFEYFQDGKLKSTEPIGNQSLLFEVLSVDNENQYVNEGFEALTVTPDQKYLVFTTEGHVRADDTIPQARRIVVYDRESEGAAVYKYYVHDEKGKSGVSDILVLDDHARELVILERLYHNKTHIDTVELYYVSLPAHNPSGNDATYVKLSDDISAATAAAESTRKFHESKILNASLLFSFENHSEYTDNYEGMTVFANAGEKPHSLILVSDDNFHRSQTTFVTTLGLQYINIADDPGWPPAPPPNTYGYHFAPSVFLLLISMLMVMLLIFYNYPTRSGSRHHDRLDDSEAEAIQIEMARSHSIEGDHGTTPLRQEQGVQVI